MDELERGRKMLQSSGELLDEEKLSRNDLFRSHMYIVTSNAKMKYYTNKVQ